MDLVVFCTFLPADLEIYENLMPVIFPTQCCQSQTQEQLAETVRKELKVIDSRAKIDAADEHDGSEKLSSVSMSNDNLVAAISEKTNETEKNIGSDGTDTTTVDEAYLNGHNPRAQVALVGTSEVKEGSSIEIVPPQTDQHNETRHGFLGQSDPGLHLYIFVHLYTYMYTYR